MTGDAGAMRRQLGRALRKARTAAGLTQEAVAKELGCLQGKINKMETTNVAVDVDELDKMLLLYGLPEKKADDLRTLARRVNHEQRRTEPVPAWPAFTDLSDLEPDAAEIRCWHSERIPRPLQSEKYLLVQFETDTRPDVDVTELLRHWKARARIFDLAEPPIYHAILSESSVRRMPRGNRELIIDQAEHLMVLLRRHESLTVQILTFDADIPSVDGDFEILRFSGDEPDFAYVEYSSGARKLKTPRDLAAFDEHWRRLRTAALSRDESLAFLDELVIETRAARPEELDK